LSQILISILFLFFVLEIESYVFSILNINNKQDEKTIRKTVDAIVAILSKDKSDRPLLRLKL